MATLVGSAKGGSFSEFRDLYEPGMAASWSVRGRTLLTHALGNTVYRKEICDFLLDQGADASVVIQPDGTNCLHILLARVLDKQYPQNNESDCALLQRLLEGGADINAVDSREGTPIQLFIYKAVNLRDESDAIRYYDVLFSRDDLDLFKIGAFGKSTYESIWQVSPRAKILWACARRYLTDRGITPPELGVPPEPQTRSGKDAS